LIAQAQLPERKVKANVVTSDRDPAVRIELLATARYNGADLLDDSKRKELIIIYSEDLATTGFTADDVSPSGKSNGR